MTESRKHTIRKQNYQQGFTLVELIVTVAIISILAIAGIPRFLGLVNRVEAKVMVGKAVGIAKECATLQLEGEPNSTVNAPNGSTPTCDGSGPAQIVSETWSSTQTLDCAQITVTGRTATLTVTTLGEISCTAA